MKKHSRTSLPLSLCGSHVSHGNSHHRRNQAHENVLERAELEHLHVGQSGKSKQQCNPCDVPSLQEQCKKCTASRTHLEGDRFTAVHLHTGLVQLLACGPIALPNQLFSPWKFVFFFSHSLFKKKTRNQKKKPKTKKKKRKVKKEIWFFKMTS